MVLPVSPKVSLGNNSPVLLYMAVEDQNTFLKKPNFLLEKYICIYPKICKAHLHAKSFSH